MIINLLNLFFPKVCLACKSHLTDNELHICISCRHQLPITDFHFDTTNAVHKILYGRVNLCQATSLLHFSKKGLVQQLMHNLKYRGHEVIGEVLGEWLGQELKQSEAYRSVDVVIPVPLHITKQRQRGYNQVDKFGKAIAIALDAEYHSKALRKTRATKTQVFKDRLKRGSTNKGSFELSDTVSFSGKHILLVDDIITTGATIEACANTLLDAKHITLSVATMAITD